MNFVYNANAVGAYYGTVMGFEQTIIAPNLIVASKKIEKYFEGEDKQLWSKHIKFNLKETIKYWVLSLLGLRGIEIYHNNGHFGIDFETGPIIQK